MSIESETADSTTLGDTTLGTDTLASTMSGDDEKDGKAAMIQEYSVRREIATKVLGAKMLQGYTLQESQCSKCGMPMMLSTENETKCVVCPVLVRKAKKKLKEEEKWAMEAQAKADEERRAKEQSYNAILKQQEMERREIERKEEEERAKQRAEEKRFEKIRREEEERLDSIRRQEEERLEAIRREEEHRLENLRREQEALLTAKRQQEQERLSKIRQEEESRLEVLRREEEAMLEAQRREEERRLEALREAERQALEQARRLEEAKLLEAKLVEEAKRNEELRLAELSRREEEARIAEQEAEAARLEYENKLIEENKRQEETRKAQERAIMEETKRLEMMEQERLTVMTRNMEHQFKAGEALRELGDNEKAKDQLVMDSQREAEIHAAEQARKEAEALALHDSERRKIEKEANLISKLETDAEQKAKAAHDAITKAQEALEEVESAKKHIYATTIAQAEANAVAEAEAIVKSQAEEFKDPNSVEHTQAHIEEQRWESLRAEGRVIMTRRMMEGWTLLSDLCIGEKCQHSPLVTKDYKVECVVCGGSGNGKDGVYAGISTRMKEETVGKSNTEKAPMPEELLEEKTKADERVRILSPTNEKSVEELKREFEEKRNQVSKEIGSKMLQGWTLLDMSCPTCVMPLMADGDGGPETCVLCGPVYMFDDSFKKPTPPEPVQKIAPSLLLGKSTTTLPPKEKKPAVLTYMQKPSLSSPPSPRMPSPMVSPRQSTMVSPRQSATNMLSPSHRASSPSMLSPLSHRNSPFLASPTSYRTSSPSSSLVSPSRDRAPSPIITALLASTRETSSREPRAELNSNGGPDRGVEPGDARMVSPKPNDPSSSVVSKGATNGLEPENFDAETEEAPPFEPDPPSTQYSGQSLLRSLSMDPDGSSMKKEMNSDEVDPVQSIRNDPPEPSNVDTTNNFDTETKYLTTTAAAQVRTDPPMNPTEGGHRERLKIEPSPSLGGISFGESASRSVGPMEPTISTDGTNNGSTDDDDHYSDDNGDDDDDDDDETHVRRTRSIRDNEPELSRVNYDPESNNDPEGVDVTAVRRTRAVPDIEPELSRVNHEPDSNNDPEGADVTSRLSNDPPEYGRPLDASGPEEQTSSSEEALIRPSESDDEFVLNLPQGYDHQDKSSIREIMSLMKNANFEENRSRNSMGLSVDVGTEDENMTSALANGTAVIHAAGPDELSNITGFTDLKRSPAAGIKQPKPEVSPTKKSYSGLTLVSEMKFQKPSPSEFTFENKKEDGHRLPFVMEETTPNDLDNAAQWQNVSDPSNGNSGNYNARPSYMSELAEDKQTEDTTTPRSSSLSLEEKTREPYQSDRFREKKMFESEDRGQGGYRSKRVQDPIPSSGGKRYTRSTYGNSSSTPSNSSSLPSETGAERSPFTERRRYDESKSQTEASSTLTPSISVESPSHSSSGMSKRRLPPRPSSSSRDHYKPSPDYSPTGRGSSSSSSRSKVRTRTRSNSPARRTPPRPEGLGGNRSLSGYSPIRSRSPRPMIPPSSRVHIVGGPMSGQATTGRHGDEMSVMSAGSRAETVASEALDVILNKIEDCKSSLVSDIASGRDIQKQTEMATLIEKLASAAVTLKKLEDLP